MDKKRVIGVDIGGQTSKLGVVDARGNILAQSIIRTDTYEDATLYVRDLASAIRALVEPLGGMENVRGVGIGVPMGNYYRGTVEYASNLKWKGVVPLAQIITLETGLPVALTNDANAAAMGEMAYGAARGMKDFIMITLGTGVGAGIVANGNILYGADGFAGELGHVIMEFDNGRPCSCGRSGCLETYTSAVGVARTARQLLAQSEQPSLLRNDDADRLTSEDVCRAAMQGDALAIETFNFTGEILGRALANFTAFSAPEAFILFGGLTKAGDLLKIPVIESLNRHVLSHWRGKVKVEFSELPESDAAILGASALAWEL